MGLVLNQQSITAKAGTGVYAPQPARTFKLSKSLAAPCGPATPCKLAGEASNGMPVITPITASTETVYCVIAYDLRNNSFDKNQHVKGWVAGEIIWLEASAAITSGDALQIAADGKVAKQVASNTVVGIAESSASDSGELVAVRLTSPYKVYGEASA